MAPVLVKLEPEQVLKTLQAQPVIAEMLASIERRTQGEITASGFLTQAIRGEGQLWVVWDGTARAILGTYLYETAWGEQQARVLFCTGRGAREWVPLIAELEAWARGEGCKRIKMLTRPGWQRLLGPHGYRVGHVELGREL